MNLEKISSLGRPLDIAYKTNALIAGLSLIMLIVITLYAALAGVVESWPAALATGVVAAVSVFLCWALARELDPDHEYAAFWGCAVIIAYMLYASRFSTNLVAALFLLLQTRALTRTTGPSPKLFDSAVIFLIAVWLSFSYSWIMGVIAALFFWLDQLPPYSCKRHKYLAAAAIAVGAGAFLITPALLQVQFTAAETILMTTVIVTFVVVIFTTRSPRSTADLTGETLNLKRIRRAQLFAVSSLALTGIWMGAGGFYDLAPLWTAMVGIFIHRLFLITRKKPAYGPDSQN